MLGLDVGDRRIGVAVCDPDERVAVPLAVIDRKVVPSPVERVIALQRQEEAELVVVGLPLSLDGTVGPQARAVQEFGRLLEAAGVRVDYWDERLTTAQVERSAIQPGRRRARRRPAKTAGPRDDLVAAAILQSYLDARRSRAPGEPSS